MTNRQLIQKLTEIIETGGSCLCGHGEWCENCSSFSSLNTIKDKIKKLIEEIDYDNIQIDKVEYVYDPRNNIMPQFNGKFFRCECGCNVFNKISEDRAVCNSCQELYEMVK